MRVNKIFLSTSPLPARERGARRGFVESESSPTTRTDRRTCRQCFLLLLLFCYPCVWVATVLPTRHRLLRSARSLRGRSRSIRLILPESRKNPLTIVRAVPLHQWRTMLSTTHHCVPLRTTHGVSITVTPRLCLPLTLPAAPSTTLG